MDYACDDVYLCMNCMGPPSQGDSDMAVSAIPDQVMDDLSAQTPKKKIMSSKKGDSNKKGVISIDTRHQSLNPVPTPIIVLTPIMRSRFPHQSSQTPNILARSHTNHLPREIPAIYRQSLKHQSSQFTHNSTQYRICRDAHWVSTHRQCNVI